MGMLELAKSVARRFEGLRLKMYRCPAGYPTIGYGHRCSSEQQPITTEVAEALLDQDMTKSYDQATSSCKELKTASDARRAAVADWVFNLGIGRFKSSTFRRRIIQGDWDEAIHECKRWVWGGGRKLPGLILRREAEAALLREGGENSEENRRSYKS